MRDKTDEVLREDSTVKVVMHRDSSSWADLACYLILALAMFLLLVYVSLMECSLKQKINTLDKQVAVLQAQVELLKPGESK